MDDLLDNDFLAYCLEKVCIGSAPGLYTVAEVKRLATLVGPDSVVAKHLSQRFDGWRTDFTEPCIVLAPTFVQQLVFYAWQRCPYTDEQKVAIEIGIMAMASLAQTMSLHRQWVEISLLAAQWACVAEAIRRILAYAKHNHMWFGGYHASNRMLDDRHVPIHGFWHASNSEWEEYGNSVDRALCDEGGYLMRVQALPRCTKCLKELRDIVDGSFYAMIEDADKPKDVYAQEFADNWKRLRP